MRKVKITGVPKANDGQEVSSNSNQNPSKFTEGAQDARGFTSSDVRVNKSVGAVPREEANVEAEGGETMVVPGQGGIPETYNITGDRHAAEGSDAEGGVPLNVDEGGFIFSDNDKKKGGMLIKDPLILAEFGMTIPKKKSFKGYTPADIAKKFDLNQFKEVLLDPDTDRIEKESAENNMIAFNLKLSKLALIQESMKGFPNGVPEIALAYLETIGADPEMFAPQEQQGPPQQEGPPQGGMAQQQGPPQQMAQQGPPQQMPMGRFGGALDKFTSKYEDGGPQQQQMQQGPPQEQPQGQQPGPEQIMQQIAEALQQGMPPEQIMQSLVQTGIPEQQAQQLIQEVMQMMEAQQQGPPPEQMQQQVQQGPPPMARDGISIGARNAQFQGQLWDSIREEGELPLAKDGIGSKIREWNQMRRDKKAAGLDGESDGELDADLRDKYNEWKANRQEKKASTTTEYSEEAVGMDADGNPIYKGDSENGNAKKKSKGNNNIIWSNEEGWEDPSQDNNYRNWQAQVANGWDGEYHSGLAYAPGGSDGPGKEVKTSSRKTSTYDVPEKFRTDPKYDENSPEYDSSLAVKGNFIRKMDGKMYKVTGTKDITPAYEGTDEDRDKTFGTTELSQESANKYQYLVNTFEDPEVTKELGDRTRAALREKANYKKKGGKGYSDQWTEADIVALTDEKIVASHLKMQKRNYALAGSGIMAKHFVDASGKVRPEFKDIYDAYDPPIKNISDAAKSIGVPISMVVDPSQRQGQDNEIGLEQATYIGYDKMIGDRENLSPELQTKITALAKTNQIGEADEDGSYNSKISNIDNWYTDTSAGELDVINGTVPEYEEAKLKEEIKKNSMLPPAQQKPLEWYAQDILNVGNLFGQTMGIRKELPQFDPVDLQSKDVLYYDPERALAANSEQQAMMAQFIGGSGSSAERAAQMSGVTGQGMTNAANILSDYENKNVQIGNDYYANIASTANQEAILNAQRKDQFLAGTAIANQQYRNAKRTTNRNLTEGMMQGITNAATAQGLNTLNEQYDTRPAVGGGVWNTGVARPLKITGESGGNYLDDYTAIQGKYPNAGHDAWRQHLKGGYGSSGMPQYQYDYDEQERRNKQEVRGGPYSYV